MGREYTYAVARIRAKEKDLLSGYDMERLILAKTYDEAIKILIEKGFNFDHAKSVEDFIKNETEKTYSLVKKLAPKDVVLNIIFYEADFHNLKAAIKKELSGENLGNIFYDYGSVSKFLIIDAVKMREFSQLPDFLREIAELSFRVFNETKDGELLECMIDKAYLEEILALGKKAKSNSIKNYCEIKVALLNLKIAARGQKNGKGKEFFQKALAECESISVSSLTDVAALGKDELLDYIIKSPYSDAIEAFKHSGAAFEKWSEDRLMKEIKKEKYNQFTIAPIFSYLVAKRTEIKMIGLILTIKKNNLATDILKERLRELYV